MPVPKRKTSRSRRDKRSSCKFIRPKAFTSCSQCNSVVAPHVACESCGYYKGKKVISTKADRDIKRGKKRKKEKNVEAQESNNQQVIEAK